MSQLRGIEADFATWRPVQGRKVLQLVFEVPIEKTQHVLDMLGIPQPGESKWCAIALLSEPDSRIGKPDLEALGDKLEKQPLSEGVQPDGSYRTVTKAHPKKWSEYARSQQAAILCDDDEFQGYIGRPLDPAQWIRDHFHIKSRKDLDEPKNGARWDEFVAIYHMHRGRLK